MSPARLQRIFEAVRAVPRGRVATYGDVAAQADCTPRQVGSALRKASPVLRLPWHRIVGAGGRIAIPGEGGLDQRMRLEAEDVAFSGRRVRLKDHRRRPRGRTAGKRE